jgi:1-deoxy-D-xylulose-5-phosphate reductoisomerase
MLKTVTILGSTGSIGASALRVIRSFPDKFKIYGLACNNNIDLLENQIAEFLPKVCAIGISDKSKIDSLKNKYKEIEFIYGENSAVEIALRPVDIVLTAIVGAAGLLPSMTAIKSAKRIALANKETLVMAGDIFMKTVIENKVELIPVDSEHGAIFAIMKNLSVTDIEKIILTASGGSLRDFYIDDLDAVTPEEALNHPTWVMGNKITIDSATLMNKGFEVIEAHYLFKIPYNKIDVVIHPESVVHSMVETVDGSVFAHMGITDMAMPILNAFSFPECIKNDFGRLDLVKRGSLHFNHCEDKRYPALNLCYEAGKTGGTMPAVINAANEIAVRAFLNKKIAFTDIAKIAENTMNSHNVIKDSNIEEIINADKEARIFAESFIKRR